MCFQFIMTESPMQYSRPLPGGQGMEEAMALLKWPIGPNMLGPWDREHYAFELNMVIYIYIYYNMVIHINMEKQKPWQI